MKNILILLIFSIPLLAKFNYGDTYTCVRYDDNSFPVVTDFNLQSRDVLLVGDRKILFYNEFQGEQRYVYAISGNTASATNSEAVQWIINQKINKVSKMHIKSNKVSSTKSIVETEIFEYDCTLKGHGLKSYNKDEDRPEQG